MKCIQTFEHRFYRPVCRALERGLLGALGQQRATLGSANRKFRVSAGSRTALQANKRSVNSDRESNLYLLLNLSILFIKSSFVSRRTSSSFAAASFRGSGKRVEPEVGAIRTE